MREQLFTETLDLFKAEDFLTHDILLDENPLEKNLRKRYKAKRCLNDIYVLSISLCERQIHVEISNVLMTARDTMRSQAMQYDKSLLNTIKEILDNTKEIKKENKQLSDKITSREIKIDEQNKKLLNLEKSNKEFAEEIINKDTASNTNQPQNEVNKIFTQNSSLPNKKYSEVVMLSQSSFIKIK